MSEKISSSNFPLTHNRTAIWLIGQPEKNLPNNVLPTMVDVLRKFFHYHKALKQTVPASAKATSNGLAHIWRKARIPMTYQPHIVSKVKACVDEYNLIKKNKGRASKSQIAREKDFSIKLDLLFDISHKDANKLIKIDEDKIFLEGQKNACMKKMAGEDVKLYQQEKQTAERQQAETKRKQNEEERRQKANAVLTPSCSHFSLDCDSDSKATEVSNIPDDNDDYEIGIPVYHKKLVTQSTDCEQSPKNKKLHILNEILSSPDVSSTLDRINLSDQKFTILAAATARASGEDLQSTPLSRSTVRRKCIMHHSSTENLIRQKFMSSEKQHMVIHWDGKMMRDSTNFENPKSNDDRIAIDVTGRNLEKTLGIVKISSGTGLARAKATFQLLTIWNVANYIVGMCFDTTASNTGSKNGGCISPEKLMKKNILYFACRHHMHEVVIGEIYSVLLGPSSGPNIALFEQFQKFWPSINQANYAPLDDPIFLNRSFSNLDQRLAAF